MFTPGGRVDVKNVSLKMLIENAYGVKDFQITGGPAWLSSAKFDVLAKAEGSVTPDQMKQMMQTLLADRFKLTFHRETKEMPAYALVAGKTGPKLKAAANDGPEGEGPGRKMGVRMGRGTISAQ